MTTLYVDRRATEAKLDGGAIVFYSAGTRLGTVPIAPLTRLVIYGSLVIDTSLLGKLGQHNVGVIIISGRRHEPVLFFPRPHNDASRRLEQASIALNERASLICARALIELKLKRQKELLEAELLRGHSRPLDLMQPIEEIAGIVERLDLRQTTSELLGAEGAAANAYFQGISTVLPASLNFHGRNTRPPRDPFNAVLSLCYTLLYAETQLTLHCLGFDPFFGVYHKPAFGRASFACDIMEALRPLVDRFAIDLIRQHVLRIEDFSTTDTGCMIGKAGRGRLYPAWENFLGAARPAIREVIALISDLFEARTKTTAQSSVGPSPL